MTDQIVKGCLAKIIAPDWATMGSVIMIKDLKDDMAKFVYYPDGMNDHWESIALREIKRVYQVAGPIGDLSPQGYMGATMAPGPIQFTDGRYGTSGKAGKSGKPGIPWIPDDYTAGPNPFRTPKWIRIVGMIGGIIFFIAIVMILVQNC